MCVPGDGSHPRRAALALARDQRGAARHDSRAGVLLALIPRTSASRCNRCRAGDGVVRAGERGALQHRA